MKKKTELPTLNVLMAMLA